MSSLHSGLTKSLDIRICSACKQRDRWSCAAFFWLLITWCLRLSKFSWLGQTSETVKRKLVIGYCSVGGIPAKKLSMPSNDVANKGPSFITIRRLSRPWVLTFIGSNGVTFRFPAQPTFLSLQHSRQQAAYMIASDRRSSPHFPTKFTTKMRVH